MKKSVTNVANGKTNGGLHSLREYKKCLKMIDLCAQEYSKAQLYHLVFVETDSQLIESESARSQAELKKIYQKVIYELSRRLRRYKIPCRWRGAYEYDEPNEEGTSKLFHFQVMIVCDATLNVPTSIINRNKSSWLSRLLDKLQVKMFINSPKGYMHLPMTWQRAVDEGKTNISDVPENELHQYMSLPKTKPLKIQDAKNWASYIYKNRSKSGVKGPIYTGWRDCTQRTKIRIEKKVSIFPFISRNSSSQVAQI